MTEHEWYVKGIEDGMNTAAFLKGLERRWSKQEGRRMLGGMWKHHVWKAKKAGDSGIEFNVTYRKAFLDGARPYVEGVTEEG